MAQLFDPAVREPSARGDAREADNRPKLLAKSDDSPAAMALPPSPGSSKRFVPRGPAMTVSSILIKVLVPVLAVVGIGFSVYHVMSTRKVTIDSAPPIEPTRSPYTNTVSGAGIIEAETENIAIGSPVAGIVTSVKCKVGDRLKVGDEMFRLDDRQLNADAKAKQASVAAAEAELNRLNAQPRTQQTRVDRAAVDEATAQAADAQDALERTKQLAEKHIAAEQDLLTKQKAFEAAQARLRRAQAQYDLTSEGAWEFDKKVTAANIDQAKANLDMVQTEIDRLSIRAYVAGEVLQVNVRPGEFVGAPANQPLVILGNIQQLHIRVDIDENDIPRFHNEGAAEASLKGHPQEKFPLKFVRVEPYVIPKKSLTGQNTERVDTRVLQVIYSLPPELKNLRVGQQVDVNINVGEASETKPTQKLDPAEKTQRSNMVL